MPLSDKLLEEGNPILDRGAEPFLGSPVQGNPAYPEITFDGLQGTSVSSGSDGPSLDEWLKPSVKKDKQVASPMVGMDELAANQRYKYYEPGADNEEIAAQGQSAWDKWGNSFAKFGATTLGTFAQGLMTIPDTVSLLRSGKISDLYQSGVENTIDTWLHNMEDRFPNYYSAYEKEHPFRAAIPFTQGSANFWGDKVIKNLGFTAGAIASAVAQDAVIGAISGGIGEIPVIGAQIGRASLWLSKILSADKKVEEVLGLGQALNATKESILSARNLARAAASVRVGNATRYALNMYGSARTEGGVEAREGYNALKKDLTDEFVAKNGFPPSGKDMMDIENSATASANVRFGINLALLGVSNAIQFDNFLRPFTASRKASAALGEGLGRIGVVKGNIDAIESVKAKTLRGKIWDKIRPKVASVLSEGVYEEGGQYAASVGTYDYYKSLHDKEISGGLKDIINSTVVGLSAQFGTQEGLENMFLGAITAGLSSSALGLVGRGKNEAHKQAVISTLNSRTLSDSLLGNYKSTAKTAEIKRDMETAVANNDVFAYKNFKHSLFYEFIQSGNKVGRFDLRMDQIKLLKELDQKEFETMFGMEFNDSNRRTANEYVDALVAKADNIKGSIDAIDKTFVNPFTRRDNPKTPEQIAENKKYSVFEDWKTELGHYSSFDYDSNSRINSITTRVAEIAPKLPVSVLYDISSKENLERLSKIYEGTVVNLTATKELATAGSEKVRLNNEIKHAQKLKDRLDTFLTSDGTNFQPLLEDIMNYEANNRVAETAPSVPKARVDELITFARDLRQLQDRKEFARKAFEKLASPKGIEDYVDDAEKKDEEATKEEETIIDGDETPPPPEEISKEMRDSLSSLGFTPEQIDALSPTQADSIVKAKLTQKAAEIEAERLAKLAEIEAQEKDAKLKAEQIKAANEKAAKEQEELKKKEAEELARAKELEILQKQIDSTAGTVITGAPDQQEPSNIKQKPISSIASTTSPQDLSTPEQLRFNRFATRYDSLSDARKSQIKVITVTANNEKALGLEGLSAYKMNGKVDNSPDGGFIATVFVEDIGGVVSFVDENFKVVGKIGSPIDINNVVYAVLASTRLETTDKKGNKVPLYINKGEKATYEEYQTAWRNTRAKILAQTDKYHISGFNLSRGIPVINITNVADGTVIYEKNQIVGTHIELKDMNKEGLIQISTTGTITPSSTGISINIPVGRPVLVHGSTVQLINNRNLTPAEVDIIYKTLVEISSEAKAGSTKFTQGTNFLQGIIHWGTPKEGKKAAANQIWFDKGILHIGPNGTVRFRKEELLASEAAMKADIAKMYNNVNNDKLTNKFNIPFEEITGVNEDGSFITKQWKTYQEYLLSPRGAATPLSTFVASKKEAGFNYTGKYITLHSLQHDINEAVSVKTNTPPSNIPSSPAQLTTLTVDTTEADKPVVTSGEFELDGLTQYKFPTSKGEIPFTAKMQEVDGKNILIVTPVENKAYETLFEDLLQRKDNDGNDLYTEETAKKKIILHIWAKVNESMKTSPKIEDRVEATPQNMPEKTNETPANTETDEAKAKRLIAEAKAKRGDRKRENPKYRRVLNNIIKVQVENWDKATAWLKANLPQVPVNRIQHLLTTTGGGYAWGMFKDAAIHIYENAEVGTVYHEAFHSVWRMFSTPSERKAITKEFRNRKGTYIDEYGISVPYAEASDDAVEEALAEEFRDYNLKGKSPQKDSKGISRILKFFAELMSTIKNFFIGEGKVEQFFKQINAGAYKNTVANVNQFNLANPVYSIIKKWNERTSHEVLEAVASIFIQKSFEEKISLVELEGGIDTRKLYDLVYQELEESFNDIKADIGDAMEDNPGSVALLSQQALQVDSLWNDIKGNWTLVTKANNQFLRTFGLVNKSKINDDHIASSVEEDINSDNTDGRGDYLVDVMTIDAKKNASTAIKLLFATLIQTEKQARNTNDRSITEAEMSVLQNPEPAYSSIGQQMLVNAAESFNHIMNVMPNVTTLNSMVANLVDLAKDYPNYVRLFTKLKGNLVNGQIDYSNLKVEDWKLLVQFFDVFAKQRPKALIQIQEGDSTYTVNANFGDAIRSTVDEFTAQVKTNSKKENAIIAFNRTTKTYDIVLDTLAKFPIRTPEDKVKLINALGIDFSIGSYYSLTPELQESFNDSIASLVGELRKDPSVMTLTGKTLSITGPLNKLAEVLVRSKGDMSESTFFNSKGDKMQASVQHNYPSLFLGDFNTVKNIGELFVKFPQLLDVWSQDSEVLKIGGKFFDEEGNRTTRQLNIGYIDGTQNKEGKSKQTAELPLAPRTMQEFNQNIRGKYYGLVPADSKTEWLLEMGNFLDYTEMSNNLMWDKTYDKFLAYLKTEIQLAQRNGRYVDTKNMYYKDNKGDSIFKGVQLRFFKDILNGDDLQGIDYLIDTDATEDEIDNYIKDNRDIKDDIKRFIHNEALATGEFLFSMDIIKEDAQGNYVWKSLDDNFKISNKIGKTLSKSQRDNVLVMRTINYMVSNIEMHKILFGDPALITDTTKRIKSFWSGTHTPIHDSPEFTNFHNEQMNKAGGIELQEGDPGYHLYKNHMKTITLKTVKSDGEIFQGADEADAQTWMIDGAYREFMQRNGYAWDKGQEKQFQYEMAWTRNYLYSIDEYKDYSPELRAHDRALLDEGNPHAGVFHVIKPKGSGMSINSSYMDMYLDKTSAAPIFLRHITREGVRMPNLAKMYIKMFKQGVDYVIMDSGRKVGAKEVHNIYDDEGNFNENPFGDNTVVNIPFRNMGLQQETSKNATRGTLGSQLSKHSTADLMENGIPIDFKGEGWISLTEEEKLAASPIYVEIAKNRKLLEDLTENGYQNILRKLGVEESEEGFSMENKEKIIEFLRGELTRRNIDANTLAGIDYNPETKEFNIPLEANPRYIQIKNILYSIVDKEIGSPKVNGGAKIMQSSLMWEEGKRTPTKGGKYAVSGVLKYYTKEEPWMEVLMPHWFSQQLRDAGFVGTDDELIQALNDSDVLSGVGFRIPTQKLSSADRFKVVGFLPQEMGATVVVPAELVVKTGGDFDVDKMNSYLRNIDITDKGKIFSVKYKGDKEATIKFYEDQFDKMLGDKKGNTQRFLTAMRYAIQDSETEEESQEFMNMFNEALERVDKYDDPNRQSKLKTAYVNMMYRKALENAYFESLENLLSIPVRFDRLMAPNSAKELKDLNQDLRKLTIPDEQLEKEASVNNHSLLLSPNYMSKMRHNFMIGKGGLGIANIAQTNHSQNQRTTIVVNLDNLGSLSEDDKAFIGDTSINLSHNTVTIKGVTYATLSGTTDKEGRFISDKISQYVDGFVDIAKDTFLIELGATPQTVSVYLLLEKFGVPSRDVVMFMNQPIIKEFVKELDYRGWSSLTNFGVYKTTVDKFKTDLDMIPEGKLNAGNFENNIKKYFKESKEFTKEENAEQIHILNEFMKYAVMANHLFAVVRGSNYDTANFNDSNLIDNKNVQTEQAREGNIFSGLVGDSFVPAVDALLENSFVGKRKEATDRVRNVISISAPIMVDSPFIRWMLSAIKGIFSQKGLFKSEKTQLQIARKVETSFIDYLIQTKLLFNNDLPELLRDQKTSVAKELDDLQRSLPEGSDLFNNPILKKLFAAPTDKEFGPKNIKLKSKDNDAYTSDLYTGGLRELRDNELTNSLYKRLCRVAILQSGIRKTPFSFTHLIPVEDYANIFAPVMRRMDSYTDLDNFVKNYAFFRNNWRDNEIVPVLLPKWFEKNYEYGYGPELDPYTYEPIIESVTPLFYNVPQSLRRLAGASDRKAKITDFIAVSHTYNKSQLKYPVIRVEKGGKNPYTGEDYTARDIAIMKSKGNYSYRDIMLYAMVMDGDNPLTHTVVKKDGTKEDVVIYKMINAWGQGDFAQEYYMTGRRSIFDNGVMKVEQELSDLEIVNAYKGTKTVDLPHSSNPIITSVPTNQTPINTEGIEEAQEFTISDVDKLISDGKVEENCT